MTRRAAGYIRRSSASSDSPGDASREAQEAAVRGLAAAFTPSDPVELFVDWGVSGGRDDRPSYVSLKRAIASDQVSAVYAYSLSRLGRRAAELDAFFTLCKEHDVRVTTQAEGVLSATTAMGQFLLQVMSAMAQLERELAKERSAVAREARKARHTAAGLVVPAATPAYGYRHVTEGGLTRVERDPDVDLQVLADAYRSVGSVRATARALNEAGVPAPRGGLWSVTPLRRVLERLGDEGLITLPRRNQATRNPRRVTGVFAGLLVCHCGRRMTPNAKRGQYYCAEARAREDHGRMSVTEKALVSILRPQVDMYVGAVPNWPEAGEDPSAMNRHLRRLWTRVQLDRDMVPTVYWRDSNWRDDERQLSR